MPYIEGNRKFDVSTLNNADRQLIANLKAGTHTEPNPADPNNTLNTWFRERGIQSLTPEQKAQKPVLRCGFNGASAPFVQRIVGAIDFTYGDNTLRTIYASDPSGNIEGLSGREKVSQVWIDSHNGHFPEGVPVTRYQSHEGQDVRMDILTQLHVDRSARSSTAYEELSQQLVPDNVINITQRRERGNNESRTNLIRPLPPFVLLDSANIS